MLRIFAICSLIAIGLVACKDPPPDVTPCLIDYNAGVAYCVPVNSSKKAFDLPIAKLHKYECFSPDDYATLQRWVVNHIK